jgi:hypothetical protein
VIDDCWRCMPQVTLVAGLPPVPRNQQASPVVSACQPVNCPSPSSPQPFRRTTDGEVTPGGLAKLREAAVTGATCRVGVAGPTGAGEANSLLIAIAAHRVAPVKGTRWWACTAREGDQGGCANACQSAGFSVSPGIAPFPPPHTHVCMPAAGGAGMCVCVCVEGAAASGSSHP